MARTKYGIQKAALSQLSRYDGFENIISLIKVAPDRFVFVGNNEITVGEIYRAIGELGERLYKVPVKTTWKTVDKSKLIADFKPVLKKAKRKAKSVR